MDVWVSWSLARLTRTVAHSMRTPPPWPPTALLEEASEEAAARNIRRTKRPNASSTPTT